ALARPGGSHARDGIPAGARIGPRLARFPGTGSGGPAQETLPIRDFGRPGNLAPGGPLPSATAVLTTTHDRPPDWLRAGQALHRLLVDAASLWVFARLQSEPLEATSLRGAVRDYLGLSGMPQMLLQFGRANAAAATPRRPVTEFIEYGEPSHAIHGR
ncbi:MAG: hypothetical protein ACRDNZ_19155, partial [Streptosporangiaceae bacterium]